MKEITKRTIVVFAILCPTVFVLHSMAWADILFWKTGYLATIFGTPSTLLLWPLSLIPIAPGSLIDGPGFWIPLVLLELLAWSWIIALLITKRAQRNHIKLSRVLLLTFALILPAPLAVATIMSSDRIKIDFTDISDASNKATWSEPDKATVSEKGLSWSRDSQSPDREWIRTEPLAVGLAWRPPHGALAQVTINSASSEFIGRVYVRYSPDLRNWSSWQYLQPDDKVEVEKNENSGTQFRLEIAIPRIEVAEYFSLLREYKEMDVPWRSDEEAAVRWILKENPDFFEHHIPFIGYVEFLIQGNQIIKAFKARVAWGVSGMDFYPPDDENLREARQGPWRFVGAEK